MRMQDVSIWNGTYNLDSIAMRQDADITDVWVWYESVSAGSYLIYIGYA